MISASDQKYREVSSRSTTDEQKISSSISSKTLSRYANTFIQRTPSYGEKAPNWITYHEKLQNHKILDHLQGRTTIGTLSRWYPEYAVLDIDNRSSIELDSIRSEFFLNTEFRSMTFTTESADSYHILFRPLYNGKPATVKLLHEVLDPYVKKRRIELYPQDSKIVRAPFNPNCRIIHRSEELHTLDERLDAFFDLTALDLKTFTKSKQANGTVLKSQKTDLPLPKSGTMKEGAELYRNGLVQPSSRYESQHKVAIWLWRQNLTPDQAIEELWTWCTTKNNGFSSDIAKAISGDYRTENAIRREHQCLVDYIWSEFERKTIYPDTTHNRHNGWLCKEDLIIAAKAANGNIPRWKFLCQLFAYFNAYGKQRLNVHSNRLIDWSSRNGYLKHLEKLEQSGILTRETSYDIGNFSKALKLQMKPSFVDLEKAFLEDEERAMTFDEAVDSMNRKDVYDLLTGNQFSRQQAHQFVENRYLVDI